MRDAIMRRANLILAELTYLQVEVERAVARDGAVYVGENQCDWLQARDLAAQLGLHCCYWRRGGRYEFRAVPFDRPLTKQDRMQWEVIR